MELNSQASSATFKALNLVHDKWLKSDTSLQCHDPFSGEVVTTVYAATPDIVDSALNAAAVAAYTIAVSKAYERARILRRASEILTARANQLAEALTRETGKTIRDARAEMQRAAEVLAFCADEAIRIEGRHIPLDGSAAGAGKLAVSMRFPIGVVAAIVPFNAPVNLSCHKVGPAFAAGNTVVLKSAPQTPYTIQLLFEVFQEAGFPAGSVNLLHGGPEIGALLIEDPRVAFISFTGSGKAGAKIKSAAGLRGCILELGGVGPTIVHSDADVTKAAEMCVANGFRLAGQSCASVQNLFVQQDVYEDFKNKMVKRVSQMRAGNPKDENTDVGPVIDETSAKRIIAWIDEARDKGATVLCGGTRDGNVVQPTLLTDVMPEMKVVCEEVFGPLVVIRPYENISKVHAWINGTGLGLNCGLFTESHAVALETFRAVPCATLIVNGTCTFRPDQMPYGGLRNSGYGRECPRDSIQAMTQERILVFNG